MPFKRKSPEPAKLETWGIQRQLTNQIEYDRCAFSRRFQVPIGRPALFKRIAEALLPGHFEYHEWTEKIIESGCSRKIVALPGAAGTAKTYNVAGFAAVWWLTEPEDSSVMFISTTSGSLRKRGWSEISRVYFELAKQKVGNFINSKMIWQIAPGDEKHCIFGKAVEEGTLTKVADDIKGVHTKRQMIVIDEATAVQGAIYDAISNLYSYPEEFILFLMANPRNRLDLFGRMIEPKEGWTSVNVDSEEWEGKPQPEYGGMVPYVIRFDAEKSPNITAGKVVSKHLPTKAKVERQRNIAGGQTPLWWSNFRGFPPPDGLSKTVFSESAIINNGGFGTFTFTGKDFVILGFFDHARNGGDRPALRFAKYGEVTGGVMAIEWLKPIIVGIDAAKNTPIDFQLMEHVRRQCESIRIGGIEHHCRPEHFGVDGTGAGAGFVDILQRHWSPRVIRVGFGTSASEDAVSPEDPRPACDVYENKSVEMHFRARNALDSGQLRGIDKDTAQELVTREFDDTGKRIKLQKKEDYKAKFGKSPDLGDSGVGIFEVARRLNFRLVPVGQTAHRHDDWEKDVSKAQAVYEEKDAYQDSEEDDYEEAYL